MGAIVVGVMVMELVRGLDFGQWMVRLEVTGCVVQDGVTQRQ